MRKFYNKSEKKRNRRVKEQESKVPEDKEKPRHQDQQVRVLFTLHFGFIITPFSFQLAS
jgi:hypothetical protein